ncbi:MULTISPECIES: hypothetical protein [Streptomyces]|uniref:Uncharacterized protein n=1 Tax=Streptomyces ramulosus TaxID=47762 RepID=A0ABW1FTV9_9ACTN
MILVTGRTDRPDQLHGGLDMFRMNSLRKIVAALALVVGAALGVAAGGGADVKAELLTSAAAPLELGDSQWG